MPNVPVRGPNVLPGHDDVVRPAACSTAGRPTTPSDHTATDPADDPVVDTTTKRLTPVLPWRRRKHREADLSHVLLPLEVVAKQTQGICRATVDPATEGMPSPDPSFISFYAEILAHGATIVRAYRGRHFGSAPPQIIEAARQRNHALHERLRQRASSDDA